MNEQTKGFNRILNAVKARKPRIHPDDARQVARIVMRKLNNIIVQGDDLAFFRENQDRVIDELITYTLKEILK